MILLVLLGVALTLAGFAGIVWSIVAVQRARRQGLGDADLRLRLQRILPVHLGALGLSVLGLMLVTLGVLLG